MTGSGGVPSRHLNGKWATLKPTLPFREKFAMAGHKRQHAKARALPRIFHTLVSSGNKTFFASLTRIGQHECLPDFTQRDSLRCFGQRAGEAFDWLAKRFYA